MEKAIAVFSSRLPRWAALRISSEGSPFAGAAQGELMASATLPDRQALEIGMVAIKRDLIESSARNQARWTLALLSFAVAIAAVGLWLIHRVIERERRLNALKSDFVASVSHELRAPIASIRLMADALESGKIEAKTATEFHRLISREGSRLSTLIENVLDFARIEQGRKRWHFEETDLLRLVTDTVTLMEPLAREKGIRLMLADTPDQATANIDPGAIQQAVVNLLDNAIKFSPADSEVEVRLTQKENLWLITVIDQGPGIPATEHQRIFEKFHRLGSELRRETQGTGIGLSLVKAVAEAHGGEASVWNGSSQGSVFTLTIPTVCQPQP
jgi:signal transduction histidine kinase